MAAMAVDECGAGATATCGNDGVPATDANPYANGITYTNLNQTLTLQSGVMVSSGANSAVWLQGAGTQTLNMASGVSIANTGSNSAILVFSAANAVSIMAPSTSVSTTGVVGYGYELFSTGAIILSAGTVTTTGAGAIPIFAQASGGPVSITTSGAVSASGNNQGGFQALNAIFAQSGGAGASGAVTINTTAGAVSLTGTTTSHAISAVSGAAAGGAVQVTTANVSTAAAGANAINATTSGTLANGNVTVNSTAGTVTTTGANAIGIFAQSSAAANGGLVTVNAGTVNSAGTGIRANSVSGAVSVTSGPITTTGANALGVDASGRGAVSITSGNVTTQGTNAHGLRGLSSGLDAAGPVTIDSTAGTVSTTGVGARGITVDNVNRGPITINAGAVSTTANDALGIRAFSGTSAAPGGGAITITASSVATQGNSVSPVVGGGADAIYAITSGNGANGRVTIDTSDGPGAALGTVSTMGDKARGIRVSSGQVASMTGGPIDITTGHVSTLGNSATAIDVFTNGIGANGNITINALGTVSTRGILEAGTNAGPASAIFALSQGGGNVSITTRDARTEGSTTGPVIRAQSSGVATVTVNTSGGTISSLGAGAIGISASTPAGGTVNITSADISTQGNLANGIAAIPTVSGGAGIAVTIDSTAGTVSTAGSNSAAITVNGGTQAISVTTDNLTTTGSGSRGINVSATGAPVTVDTTAGSILTTATTSDGIGISAGSGTIGVTTGPITVRGNGSSANSPIIGIGVSSSGVKTIDSSGGAILMEGTSNTTGIRALGAGATAITAGQITASGLNGTGVRAQTTNSGASGAINLTFAGAVNTSGRFGIGTLSFNGNNAGSTVDATVATGASVMGGWQADPNTPGPSGAAAGIVIGAEAGTRPLASRLTNNGTVGALSDLAIATADLGVFGQPGLGYDWIDPGGGIEVENNGTITGYVVFGPAANIFRNISANSFNLRHFADTDGDGVRDTKRLAVADFGGPGALFDNVGTLRLAPVTGNTATDSTGQYVPTSGIAATPLDAAFHDIARPGVVQGHLVNLATFRNAGAIIMQNGVVGDVLVITGDNSAGARAATGVFVSDGGRLLLDSELNEGMHTGAPLASRSDVLVLDQTQLGAGGASRVFVNNIGGLGALTPGNGIELVEVRDKAASATGVFVLGQRTAAGAFEYNLFHNGIGADDADGNWYLRSTLIITPPTPPVDEPAGSPGGGGGTGETAASGGAGTSASARATIVVPNFRPEVPLYAALPGLAHQFGFAMLGTLNERINDSGGFGGTMPLATRALACPEAAPGVDCRWTADSGAGLTATALPRGGAWARLFGRSGDHKPGSFFSGNGPSYDYDLGGFQAGLDLFRREHLNGARSIVGFSVGAGRAEGDVRHIFGGPAGSMSLDATSLGLYATHIGAAGWYADAVVQGTRFEEVSARSVLGQGIETEGWGVTASLEGGYPIDLGQAWSIEPQAQLIYQNISLDGAADAFGLVRYGSPEALRGRLGARLARTFALNESAQPRLLTAWARVNLWHGFGGDPQTAISALNGLNALAFTTDLDGTWAQIGAGASGEILRNVALFASGDYSVALDGTESAGWGGRIGLKVTW